MKAVDAELRAALIQSADQTLSRANEVLLAKSVAVESLESVRDQFKDEWKGKEPKEKEIPSSLVSRAQGLGWLKDEFKDSKQLANMQAAYEKRFDELTPERLEKLGNQMLEVKTQLQESRLVVLPADWSDYLARWSDPVVWGRIPGVFMSILLLSLGAPFWFNALRTLASLRPILAGKTDPSKAEKG